MNRTRCAKTRAILYALNLSNLFGAHAGDGVGSLAVHVINSGMIGADSAKELRN